MCPRCCLRHSGSSILECTAENWTRSVLLLLGGTYFLCMILLASLHHWIVNVLRIQIFHYLVYEAEIYHTKCRATFTSLYEPLARITNVYCAGHGIGCSRHDEVTPLQRPHLVYTPLKQEASSTLHSPLSQGNIFKKLAFMLHLDYVICYWNVRDKHFRFLTLIN